MANRRLTLARATAAVSEAAADGPDSEKLQNNSKQRDLARQIAALGEASYAELQTLWSRHFRYRAPKKLAREQLELGIAWKLQAHLHGGLNVATRHRLNDLAQMLVMNANPVQKRTITLKPGARLLRAWGGRPTRSLS
jgi:hypothetical protein